MERALRDWVAREAIAHPELRRLGYFGSYARGDWGVGSDLDLVAIVSRSTEPFERRALTWNLEELPVPADLLIYTEAEWDRMQAQKNLFARRLAQEVKWVYP
ncbi:MAG TPA: nucleotidyltransferase domain-containing protein [Vicinamibacteria bacterium]|nr:nucleotidyltransferase domain-containing protein [Vicinamibacteria bacterium]